MGQRIQIDTTTVVDRSAIFVTDRSLTGTDGEGFSSVADTDGVDTFPAKLAAELFEVDPALDRVYVDQNSVVLTRDGGWVDDVLESTRGVIGDFFLFYG